MNEIVRWHGTQEYAKCQGDWSITEAAGDRSSTNEALGELLGELASKSRTAGPLLAALAAWPLKVALIGKPYAGKSCAAQHMADKLSLKVCKPTERLLRRSISFNTNGCQDDALGHVIESACNMWSCKCGNSHARGHPGGGGGGGGVQMRSASWRQGIHT